MKGSLEPRLLLALIMTEICSLSLSRQVSRMLQTQTSSVKLFRPARYTDLEITRRRCRLKSAPRDSIRPRNKFCAISIVDVSKFATRQFVFT